MASLPCTAPGAPWQWLTLLLLTVMGLHPAAAQAPPWTQVTLASDGGSRINASATDASGNVFVAGVIYGTVTFGTTTLTADNLGDGFVAKWSPVTGQFVWAQRIGGQDGDTAMALAVRDSLVYVSGISNSGTTYAGSLSTQVLSSGGSGTFLAKLSDRGNHSAFVWLRGMRTNAGSISALVVSGTDVYAAGSYRGALYLESQVILRNPAYSSDSNVFIMKLADGGSEPTLTWVQQAGGDKEDFISALAVVGNSVYVAGNFASSKATFGTTTLTNVDLVSYYPYFDVFVAKLTDAGATSSFVWARQAGSPGIDQVNALAVMGPTIYLAGTFNGATPTFNGTTATFGTQTLTTAGGADGFVAKLVDAGPNADFQWAQRVGGPANDRLSGLVVAGSHLYVAGSFQGTATFGSATLSATSKGSYDGFVAHLVDAGTNASVGWVQTAGGTQEDNASALVLLPATSRLYVAGNVGPSPSFGTLSPLSTTPYTTAFVAELGPVEILGTMPLPTAPAPVPAAPAPVPTPAPASVLTPTLLPYPNPAHGYTAVALPAGLPGSPVALMVFDMLGRVVSRASATLDATAMLVNIDLGGLAPGVYALRIAMGSAVTTPRLVVE